MTRELHCAYYTVAVAIALEATLLVVAIAALLMGFGFRDLRAAALLLMLSSIVAVSAVSAYPCCCSRGEGRRPFLGGLGAAAALAFVALLVAATSTKHSPCIERACYNELSQGLDSLCQKCSKTGKEKKDGCSPKYSYYCAADYDDVASVLTDDDVFHPDGSYVRCPRVQYCSRWDADCHGDGVDDDGWFWGYETKADCETAEHVRTLFDGSRDTTIAVAVLGILLRALVAYTVYSAPTGPSAMRVTPDDPSRGVGRSVDVHGDVAPVVIPVEVRAVELAPVVNVTAICATTSSSSNGGAASIADSDDLQNLPHATLRHDAQFVK